MITLRKNLILRSPHSGRLEGRAALQQEATLVAARQICQNLLVNKAIATRALLLAATAALAGCSESQPFIASGDAKSVQVNYSGDAASALPLARRHCAQYER